MNTSVCVRSHGKHIPVYFNIMLSVSGSWIIYFLCQVVVIYAMTLKRNLFGWMMVSFLLSTFLSPSSPPCSSQP